MLFVICFFLVSVTLNVSALEVCPKCGSMDVPYPLSTNDICGNPKYRVHCNNGTLEFSPTGGVNYKILSINPSSYSFIISPPFIKQNTCESSDFNDGGLIIDDNSPFNISKRNTVMLLNCSDNLLCSPLDCSSRSLCRQFEEKAGEASGCRNTLCCTYLKDSSMNSHRIRVRVGGCTAYTCVVDMKQGEPFEAWNYGIELQWLPPN